VRWEQKVSATIDTRVYFIRKTQLRQLRRFHRSDLTSRGRERSGGRVIDLPTMDSSCLEGWAGDVPVDVDVDKIGRDW
jgi:hypothetical protein